MMMMMTVSLRSSYSSMIHAVQFSLMIETNWSIDATKVFVCFVASNLTKDVLKNYINRQTNA